MNVPHRLRVLCLPTGPDEYAVAMVRALSAVADVVFIAPAALVERYRDDLPASVQVHTLPWPRHRSPANLLMLARILRIVQATRPDVIHFLGDSVVWLLLGLPWFRRYPLIVTVHDVSYHPGDVQSANVPMTTVHWLRRAAHAAVVHGPGLLQDLAATGVKPQGGIHVVAHPILDRHRRLADRLGLRHRSSDGAQRVLFFGRALAYKGLDLLIAASDRVIARQPDTRFIVAGTGPELERLRSDLVRRPWFDLQDRFIPDAQVARLFLDADLVVLPYREASQSGVAALAAAFHVPVVATDLGELGPLVRSTGIGIVTAPDERELAEAMLRLLEEPDTRSVYASAARAAALGLLSPDRVAAATLRLYRQLLASRAHVPAERSTLEGTADVR